MNDLHAELFCDPYATGLWRHRSLLVHVAYAFSELEWTVRPVVAVPAPLSGSSASAYAESARRAGTAAGLPVADDLFADGVPASWGACEALTAVRATEPAAALPYLHRLASRVFAAGSPPETPAELADLATSLPGVDADVVREAVGSRRAAAAVGRDLERGRDLFARLEAHEVRGDPESVPLGPRLYGDGRLPPEPLRRRSVDENTGGESSNEDDADGSDGGAADAEANGTDDSEPRVPRAPLVRIVAGEYTVVVDPRTGFDEFVDVLRRYDPDLGDLDWQARLHGRHVMRAYGMGKRTAENLSSERYADKVRTILADVDEAFVPDLAACADLDPDTCRVAVRELKLRGDVERTDGGGWSLSN